MRSNVGLCFSTLERLVGCNGCNNRRDILKCYRRRQISTAVCRQLASPCSIISKIPGIEMAVREVEERLETQRLNGTFWSSSPEHINSPILDSDEVAYQTGKQRSGTMCYHGDVTSKCCWPVNRSYSKAKNSATLKSSFWLWSK